MAKTQKKLIVRKLTTDFRAAVAIETCDICMPKEGEVCVKNKYVGINADDIHVTKGRKHFAEEDPPFGCGLEGMGHVVAVGKGVSNIKVGDPVMYIEYKHSAFAEYTCVQVKDVYNVPSVKPEYLSLLVYGITAVLGIEQDGKLKKGEKILITGASGGHGTMAVQVAKNIGCYVVATCSTKEKEKFLKDLGCDRVINYCIEDMDEILSKEYPDGMDVIWEAVGGPVFEICLRHIASKGRIIFMGERSEYQKENELRFPKAELSSLKETIFYKWVSVTGGCIEKWYELWHSSYQTMLRRYEKGEIKIFYHTGDDKSEFIGMEGIIEAMEHFCRGKHIGKVIATVY